MLGDAVYWRSCCPQLHIGDPEFLERAKASVMQPSPELVQKCRSRMDRDGYFDLSAGLVDWAASLQNLADGVAQLEKLGWPPNFVLMFDEAWMLVHQLKDLMHLVTGNQLIFDFSVFHVHAPALTELAAAFIGLR